MLIRKTGIMQVLRERFAPTERFHALVQIRVRRLVSAHDTADERQHAREIYIV